MVRYPCLIDKRFCKTPIHILIETEELNKYGEPLGALEADLTCNYQDTSKTVLTAEKKLIQLNGIALFPGDIAPDMPTISGGAATVYGVERTIFSGTKARNPDGTVNYSKLELI